MDRYGPWWFDHFHSHGKQHVAATSDENFCSASDDEEDSQDLDGAPYNAADAAWDRRRSVSGSDEKMNLSKPKLSFQFTLGVTWSNICLTKPRLEPYEKGATLLPLWCDPFIVPEEDGNHQSSHLVMVACTMFNAALEYHVRALRQPNDDNRADEHIARVVDSMRNYSTALKMYRQCLQILRNGHQIKACSSTSQWVIFKIALINNIGHCCAHLGMYATSENFYQELSSTLW
eukprot:CAMPEP_0176034396 /NCGR_PEP_ID=MMETSP0120_2-20121206/17001_1 /TAXON_ID=160619 /ORGANISM="Kryptoperidinium foliaceum, Strain CCMP 1326" /LENGTH=231 /DNA_ID=CAMNT_0017367735 /DNA_START=103 /DNA_END=796 /DNA_ORIENTATION=+